jgi:hypothetical protein
MGLLVRVERGRGWTALVLPDPRKPVMIVIGIMVGEMCGDWQQVGCSRLSDFNHRDAKLWKKASNTWRSLLSISDATCLAGSTDSR